MKFLVCYLFDLLVATGLGLQCERCVSRTRSCTGDVHHCSESEKSCVILTVESIIEKERWFATYKGCTETRHCRSSAMSFTFPSQHKKRVAKCCRHDFCNKGTVKLKKTEKKLNGLKCPGCFSTDLHCQPRQTLNCVDQEYKCIYMALTMKLNNENHTYAKRGCGTWQACKRNEHTFVIPELYAETWKNITCTQAAK